MTHNWSTNNVVLVLIFPNINHFYIATNAGTTGSTRQSGRSATSSARSASCAMRRAAAVTIESTSARRWSRRSTRATPRAGERGSTEDSVCRTYLILDNSSDFIYFINSLSAVCLWCWYQLFRCWIMQNSYNPRSAETTERAVIAPIDRNELGILTNLIDPKSATDVAETRTEMTEIDIHNSIGDGSSDERTTDAPMLDELVAKSVILVSSSVPLLTRLCFWC